MASDDAYDVFVSYARSDGAAAAGLNGWLVVSYETVRRWAIKFGWDYARRLKRKRASRRDTGTGIVNLSEGRPKKGDFLKGEVRR
jgi:hypothetical protein